MLIAPEPPELWFTTAGPTGEADDCNRVSRGPNHTGCGNEGKRVVAKEAASPVLPKLLGVQGPFTDTAKGTDQSCRQTDGKLARGKCGDVTLLCGFPGFRPCPPWGRGQLRAGWRKQLGATTWCKGTGVPAVRQGPAPGWPGRRGREVLGAHSWVGGALSRSRPIGAWGGFVFILSETRSQAAAGALAGWTLRCLLRAKYHLGRSPCPT